MKRPVSFKDDFRRNGGGGRRRNAGDSVTRRRRVEPMTRTVSMRSVCPCGPHVVVNQQGTAGESKQ